ncbi:response regulator transcription factor [Burkholderiaceae bacterium DAT-1]|nr:response regulator transcription factor [Burkholderiaceae bacterium DAT-1]
MTPTCLIVDDHPIVRLGLGRIVGQCQPDWQIVEAGTLAEAREMLAKHPIRLVMLDMRLGKESGLTLLKDIRSQWPLLPVLVLSMHDDPALIDQALAAGARGYLVKDLAAKQLAEAIQAVLSGRRYVPAHLAERLYFHHIEPGGFDSLTPRERQIFALLAEGQCKKKMALALGISANTVETHRQRLRAKLGARDNLQLVQMAVRRFGQAAELAI